MPRKAKPIHITSKSSDAEIYAWIGQINNKMRSYADKTVKRDLGNDWTYEATRASNTLVQTLSFDPNSNLSIPTEWSKDGNIAYIPVDKKKGTSVARIRDVLRRQENKAIMQMEKDETFIPSKTVAEMASSLPSYSERVERVKEQMKDPKKKNLTDGLILPEKGTKSQIAEAKKWNREQAVEEVRERALREWADDNGTLDEAVAKAYEKEKQLLAKISDYNGKDLSVLQDLHTQLYEVQSIISELKEPGKTEGATYERLNIIVEGVKLPDY